MSRGPCAFTEAGVTRALKAAQKAGLSVHKFEIDRTGKIVVTTAKGEDSATDLPTGEPVPPEDIVL
jgi:hypothetical protein